MKTDPDRDTHEPLTSMPARLIGPAIQYGPLRLDEHGREPQSIVQNRRYLKQMREQARELGLPIPVGVLTRCPRKK